MKKDKRALEEKKSIKGILDDLKDLNKKKVDVPPFRLKLKDISSWPAEGSIQLPSDIKSLEVVDGVMEIKC